MMLLWRLRKRLLGRFLPFIGVFASFLACCAAFASALARAAAASFSCLASSGSRLTCAGQGKVQHTEHAQLRLWSLGLLRCICLSVGLCSCRQFPLPGWSKCHLANGVGHEHDHVRLQLVQQAMHFLLTCMLRLQVLHT